jgi:non-homologous end joining protein Ku
MIFGRDRDYCSGAYKPERVRGTVINLMDALRKSARAGNLPGQGAGETGGDSKK